jgi:zinc and cadmium transporter
MTDSVPLIALTLFALTFVGGVLPLLGRWSERGLHVLAAVSAGLFLGLVFLHLLPELALQGHAAHRTDESGMQVGASELAERLPWICTLAGFLGLFFVEKLWLEGHSRRDQHRAVWHASYVGLIIHTAFTGLGLAAVLPDERMRWVIVLAVVAHKGSEAFSLATLMQLAGLGRRRALGYLAVYAAVAPLGLALGVLGESMDPLIAGSLLGIACGTFLYVAVCDLLPEVFHGEAPGWSKALWVLLGGAAAGAIQWVLPHTHA